MVWGVKCRPTVLVRAYDVDVEPQTSQKILQYVRAPLQGMPDPSYFWLTLGTCQGVQSCQKNPGARSDDSNPSKQLKLAPRPEWESQFHLPQTCRFHLHLDIHVLAYERQPSRLSPSPDEPQE